MNDSSRLCTQKKDPWSERGTKGVSEPFVVQSRFPELITRTDNISLQEGLHHLEEEAWKNLENAVFYQDLLLGERTRASQIQQLIERDSLC